MRGFFFVGTTCQAYCNLLFCVLIVRVDFVAFSLRNSNRYLFMLNISLKTRTMTRIIGFVFPSIPRVHRVIEFYTIATYILRSIYTGSGISVCSSH